MFVHLAFWHSGSTSPYCIALHVPVFVGQRGKPLMAAETAIVMGYQTPLPYNYLAHLSSPIYTSELGATARPVMSKQAKHWQLGEARQQLALLNS